MGGHRAARAAQHIVKRLHQLHRVVCCGHGKRGRKRAGGSRTSLCAHVCAEFPAAIFVASCVALLNHADLLDNLQVNTLQVAVPYMLKAVPHLGEKNNKAAHSDTTVVVITDLLHEEAFKHASPLDRTVLHKLLKGILAEERRPRVLAIDIDLSPQGADPSEAEEALYGFLKKEARRTPIVLITPNPVFMAERIAARARWMRQMCDAGVHFGLPYLYSIQGVVLKRDTDPNALASVAARQGASAPDQTSSRGLCGRSEDEFRTLVGGYTHQSILPEKRFGTLQLLNFKARHAIGSLRLNTLPLDHEDKPKLRGRVVFVGGDYGQTDKYDTPIGTLAGIYLHAAGYYSIKHKITVFGHVLGYFIEIVIGTVLGVLFAMLAQWYQRSRSLVSGVLNFTIQPLLAYLFIVLSALLLRVDVWTNPALLIAGMAIHANLMEAQPDHGTTTRRRMPNFERLFKRIAFVTIIGGAWVLLLVA